MEVFVRIGRMSLYGWSLVFSDDVSALCRQTFFQRVDFVTETLDETLDGHANGMFRRPPGGLFAGLPTLTDDI